MGSLIILDRIFSQENQLSHGYPGLISLYRPCNGVDGDEESSTQDLPLPQIRDVFCTDLEIVLLRASFDPPSHHPLFPLIVRHSYNICKIYTIYVVYKNEFVLLSQPDPNFNLTKATHNLTLVPTTLHPHKPSK